MFTPLIPSLYGWLYHQTGLDSFSKGPYVVKVTMLTLSGSVDPYSTSGVVG